MNLITLILVASLLAKSQVHAKEPPRRILIGVSQIEHMGDPDKHEAKNSLWEVAPAYHVFRMHGYEIDFVSPNGGAVPFSREVDEIDPPGMVSYTIKYENFRKKTRNTLAAKHVDTKKYAAYFVAGGAGPLFDIAQNPTVLSIAAAIYDNGGGLGGCGHGPGSLANIKRGNGDYVVKGVRVTGFPNSTEKTKDWAKNGTLLPFLVEDILRARGGLFLTKEDLADKFAVIVDQRVVTTMFMSSCANAAEELVRVVELKRK
jgi:putative intracellular protease/amidase